MHRAEKIRRRLKAGKKPREDTTQVRLRHGGVYALPGGAELVAAAAPGGRNVLYHPLVWSGQAWVVNMPVAFVVTEEGHLFKRTGEPTGWRVEDLVDTRVPPRGIKQRA